MAERGFSPTTRLLLLAVLGLSAVAQGIAQTDRGGQPPSPLGSDVRFDRPAWVYYQEGLRLYRQQFLGEALRQFRNALATRNPYPEAEAAIGMIYQAEGRIALAVRQYQRALQQRAFFDYPEEETAVMYHLATAHLQAQDRHLYEQTLQRIVATEPLFADTANQRLRAAMANTLLTDGFDRLAILYRNVDLSTLEAHSRLGEHFVRSGNYTAALGHLLLANLKMVSAVVSALRQRQPNYTYTTMARLLNDALSSEESRWFLLEDNDIWKQHYWLGVAAYGVAPVSPTPRAIWRLLASRPDAGIWSDRATAQLASPNLEISIDF